MVTDYLLLLFYKSTFGKSSVDLCKFHVSGGLRLPGRLTEETMRWTDPLDGGLLGHGLVCSQSQIFIIANKRVVHEESDYIILKFFSLNSI